MSKLFNSIIKSSRSELVIFICFYRYSLQIIITLYKLNSEQVWIEIIKKYQYGMSELFTYSRVFKMF